MRRRTFITALSAMGAFAAPGSASGQTASFEALLSELEADPTLVESAWSSSLRQNGGERGIGRGTPSTRTISERSIDMIVRLEVSSKARYEQRYTHPIWPGGMSGVTIGIGYDLQFASHEQLVRDWGGLLDEQMLATLETVLQLGGAEARAALAGVQSVTVPWDAAHLQFRRFLPYPTAETENVFPNSSALSDDSFGALVSLVYNRGVSIAAGSDRRREMREIRELMSARDFAPIPEKIRGMKRLWPNQPGLVLRRELEAQLFEIGRM